MEAVCDPIYTNFIPVAPQARIFRVVTCLEAWGTNGCLLSTELVQPPLSGSDNVQFYSREFGLHCAPKSWQPITAGLGHTVAVLNTNEILICQLAAAELFVKDYPR